MTAQQAIERLAKDPGYLIIGVPKQHRHLFPGDITYEFAGHPLPPNQMLVVEQDATRKEWQTQQIKLFGQIKNRTPGHYYRCLKPIAERVK